MRKENNEEGYCVCCPRCGKTNQKSIETASKILCPRCNREYMVFLKDNTMIQIIKVDDEASVRRAAFIWEKFSEPAETMQLG